MGMLLLLLVLLFLVPLGKGIDYPGRAICPGRVGPGGAFAKARRPVSRLEKERSPHACGHIQQYRHFHLGNRRKNCTNENVSR